MMVSKFTRVLKLTLLSTCVTLFFLIFFSLFGDALELPAVRFLTSAFTLVIFGIIGIHIGLSEWLLKRSFLELILFNSIAVILAIIHIDKISSIVEQLRKYVGGKICGEECYVKK